MQNRHAMQHRKPGFIHKIYENIIRLIGDGKLACTPELFPPQKD